MPPLVIAAGIAAAGAIGGAKISSDSSEHAADTTTAAANHAADVQASGAKEHLAFEEAQAQNQAQNDAINREANYRLMAAKAAKIASLGQLLGLGGVDVPAYVPGVTPNFSAGQPAPPMGQPQPRPPMPDVQTALGMPAPDQPPPAAADMSGLELQPDGTYKIRKAVPVGSVGQLVGA